MSGSGRAPAPVHADASDVSGRFAQSYRSRMTHAATAWISVRASSFLRARDECVRTQAAVMPIRSAISFCVSPWADSLSTCDS